MLPKAAAAAAKQHHRPHQLESCGEWPKEHNSKQHCQCATLSDRVFDCHYLLPLVLLITVEKRREGKERGNDDAANLGIHTALVGQFKLKRWW